MKRDEPWSIDEAARRPSIAPAPSLDPLAVAAHELRTPMTGVLGLLGVLADTRLDAEQRAMVETMRDAVGELLVAVDGLLDRAKDEASRRSSAAGGRFERAKGGAWCADSMRLTAAFEPLDLLCDRERREAWRGGAMRSSSSFELLDRVKRDATAVPSARSSPCEPLMRLTDGVKHEASAASQVQPSSLNLLDVTGAPGTPSRSFDLLDGLPASVKRDVTAARRMQPPSFELADVLPDSVKRDARTAPSMRSSRFESPGRRNHGAVKLLPMRPSPRELRDPRNPHKPPPDRFTKSSPTTPTSHRPSPHGSFDLRTLTGTALELLGSLANQKGLSLTVDVKQNVATHFIGDAMPLRRLIFNLVGNAIRFTERGSVDMRVSVAGSDARHQSIAIEITDTGIGIAPERQRALFQPFVQAEPSTAQRFGGTGLGLAICRELAAQIGATLHLHSEPGVGTCVTVRVTMPVAADRTGDTSLMPVKPHTSSPRRQRVHANAPRVLLVDDHPVNRLLLRHHLTALGFACDVASDGTEALAMLERERDTGAARYHCLISDCRMPGLSGCALAQRVRERERGPESSARRMPILGITASLDRRDFLACRAAGMDDCIAKPVDVDALRAALRRWFDIRDIENVVPAPPALDLQQMAQSWGGEPILKTLLATFVSTVRDDVRALEPLLEQPEPQRLLEWHHRIAGAAAVLRHAPLLAALDAYRRAVETQPAVQLRIGGLALAAACHAMLDEIERHAAQLAGPTHANTNANPDASTNPPPQKPQA